MNQTKVQEKEAVGAQSVVDVADPKANPIVPAGGVGISLDELSRDIETAAAAQKKMVAACISLIGAHHFQQWGDKLEIDADGAIALAAKLGMQIEAVSQDMFEETKVGDDFFYECIVCVKWPRFGLEYTEIGSADTLDQFFTNDQDRCVYNQFLAQCGDDVAMAKRKLSPWIKKKAYGNGVKRAVARMLGLKGIPVAEFEKLGYAPGTKVEFRKGGTKSSAAAAKAAPKKVTIAEAVKLPIGSTVAFHGVIVSISKAQKFHKYTLHEGAQQINVIKWTGDELPQWAARDEQVWCNSVLIKEYQGNRQYVAESIEHASAPGVEEQAQAGSEQPV